MSEGKGLARAGPLDGPELAGIGTSDGGGKRAGTQAIERALSLLALFRHENPALSTSEMASALGLHLSTVHRIASTLETARYLQRDARTGYYCLGFAPVELAGMALNQADFVRHSLSELDRLCDLLNLNANLAVLQGDDVVHLAYAVRKGTAHYYTVIGRRAVPHCTALGKVLLGALPLVTVHDMIVRKGWRPCTVHSIDNFDRLDSELHAVREQGYAIDHEERNLGSVCVGAPVRDRAGRVVAAISVTGSLEELRADRLKPIVDAVLQHASRASQRLGYITGH
jgi:DNA-binding IclR family transcriptional regulator